MLGAMADVTVTRCPTDLRVEALRLLRAAGRSEEKDLLAAAVESAAPRGEAAWDGLFVLGEPPAAALWVQVTDGNSAVVWPPAQDDAVVDVLYQAAAEFVDARRVGVAQIIATAADGFRDDAMARRGFPRLADLVYMFAEPVPRGPQKSHLSQSLQFVPRAGDDPARLAALIEQTYVGTCDCPALDGARAMDDVLAGYEAQGGRRPEHWYFVADGAQDVGVLLMAEHSATANWELVYMGIVPAARGRALGAQIVQFAREIVGRERAHRLVLAVDAANAPALAMYRRSGFFEWDRRIVFARLGAAARRD
jgi:mycothiol synthase